MSRIRSFVADLRHGLGAVIDLIAIIAIVVLTNLAVLYTSGGTVVSLLLGSLFVLFAPGYALVAALFPESGQPITSTAEKGDSRLFVLDRDGGRRSIDLIERLGLAFALSIVLVPLLMLGITLLPVGFTVVPILVAISAWTVICIGIATIRRWSLPGHKRFRVSYHSGSTSGTNPLVNSNSVFESVLNLGLAAAILLTVITGAFAVSAPPDGEQYTEFYVLTEDSNGSLVSTNYPESVSPNNPEQLHVGLENYEGETRNYSVVVQLQRIDRSGTEPRVTEIAILDQFSMSADHNESTVRAQNVSFPDGFTGQDLRLTFLLYDDSVPAVPRSENAYREVHLWIDVIPETA